jgi:50S ribosomal subunit-associated GTPase HflX
MQANRRNALLKLDVYAADKLFAPLIRPRAALVSWVRWPKSIRFYSRWDSFMNFKSLVDAFFAPLSKKYQGADVLVHRRCFSFRMGRSVKAVNKILKDMRSRWVQFYCLYLKVGTSWNRVSFDNAPTSIAISALERPGLPKWNKSLLKLIEYTIGELD